MPVEMDDEESGSVPQECDGCGLMFKAIKLRTVRDRNPDEPGSYTDMRLCPLCVKTFGGA